MIRFQFADIGEGLTEGQLLKWYVEPGDLIKEGDPLFLVETDKVTADIPSPASGTIQEKFYDIGDLIQVGNLMVIINDGKESTPSPPKVDHQPLAEKKSSAGVVGQLEVSNEVIPGAEKQSQAKKHQKVLATPVARKLAKDLGIDIQDIQGTGPNMRVMKADIQKAADQSIPSQSPTSEKVAKSTVTSGIDRPLSQLRKTIAKNMQASKQNIPHAVSMDELDVTHLVALRKAQKEAAKEEGIKLTFLPFIIKALAFGLQEHPHMNASLDLEKGLLRIHKEIHIGIAVDTPDGLLVPVIRNANQKGILQLAKEIQMLAEKARTRTLTLDEMKDATFTITNYGAVGTSIGIPIIPRGQVAILGIGRIQEKPSVINKQILPRHQLPITISIDHRALDGADAGRLSTSLRRVLENPMELLLR
ncbi:dihydrolipoamide acetyltransferase family protein [Gottschalkiaceae bacterium SANA]|nr:dihydrolipoamide acetyltransferase family protein [Gottschalkiaceae bacterium SANA]